MRNDIAISLGIHGKYLLKEGYQNYPMPERIISWVYKLFEPAT
jgi:hypothetical protein